MPVFLFSIFSVMSLLGLLNNTYAAVYKDGDIQRVISEMNRVDYTPRFQTINVHGANEKIKILVIGNSISVHAIDAHLPWGRISGMAASSENNDYVHLLMSNISDKKKVAVEFIVLNLSEFERGFEEFEISRLYRYAQFQPDYVIFQLGENVKNEVFPAKYDSFLYSYVNLVNYFPNSKKIVCLPFWPNQYKIELLKAAAKKTGSTISDLAKLGGDERNFARSERAFNNKGIGIHPGDTGMYNIANVIYLSFDSIYAN